MTILSFPLKTQTTRRSVYLLPSISIIFLVFLLIGCRVKPPVSQHHTTPVSYNSLCHIDQITFTNMEPNTLKTWINETFGVDPDVFFENDEMTYAWEVTESNMDFFGNAKLINDKLTEVTYHDIQNGPSFGDVYDGLGEPSAVYRHYEEYEQVMYFLGLVYPQLGLSVYTSEIKPRHTLLVDNQLAVTLLEDMRTNLIACYRSAETIEKVLERDLQNYPIALKTQLSSITQWTGFGSDIILEDK